MNELGPLIWLVFLGLVLYFLMIRPARTRQRQALQIQSSLQPGLEVMTTAGLYATVSAVTDDQVVLEVAPGVLNRYAKGAVARIVTPAESADTLPEQDSVDGTGPGRTRPDEDGPDGTGTSGTGSPGTPGTPGTPGSPAAG